jgi:hypothetical protein
VRQARYARTRRGADQELMNRAWALALTPIGDARPPHKAKPLRVVTQRRVPTDGVSEAGLSGEAVASLFVSFDGVDIVQIDDLQTLDWKQLPNDGRPTVLVSNQRARYGDASHRWRPQLHVALWNPFQVLDVPAPAVVTWGFADGALAALRAWLEGMVGTSWIAGRMVPCSGYMPCKALFVEGRAIAAFRVGGHDRKQRYGEVYAIAGALDPDRDTSADRIIEAGAGVSYGAWEQWRLQAGFDVWRFGDAAPLGIETFAAAPANSTRVLVQLGARF